MHLGGGNGSGFPKEIADEIRAEVRLTFKNMADFAEREGASVILLAGDVFDSDKPFKKDKDFFYSVVKSHPSIDFLYLKGNHDAFGETEVLPNLITFSDKWTTVDRGVKFHGLEMTRENSSSLYSTLNLDENDVNVVMLHGTKGSGTGKDVVNLSKLRGKNIDYLALGHIHTYSSEEIDERGAAVYSGCLSGRGFDETGKKGFVLVTVDGKTVSHEFVPFSRKIIREETVDISAAADAYSAAQVIKNTVKINRGDIIKINVVGSLGADIPDLGKDLNDYLSGECEYIEIKDKTVLKLDLASKMRDNTLIGEFIRAVEASDKYTEEEKSKIISFGLRAINGEKVD